MHYKSNEDCEVSLELGRAAINYWSTTAAIAGVDLEGFDLEANHDNQVAWARSKGLIVGTVYSRFSTKLQQSTEDQVG